MSQLTTPSDPDLPSSPLTPDTLQAEPDSRPVPAMTSADGPATPKPEESKQTDEHTTSRDEAPPSAGEGGEAADGAVPAPGRDGSEVIIGEIPDIHDLSIMRWTARCTLEKHDLLGHYDTREEAERAKSEHLASQHPAP